MTKIQKTQIIVSIINNSAGPLLSADNNDVKNYYEKNSKETIDSMYAASKILTDAEEWDNLHKALATD